MALKDSIAVQRGSIWTSNIFGQAATWASVGASVSGPLAGLGAALGAVAGALFGLVTGGLQDAQLKEQYRGQRDQFIIDRMEAAEQRNDMILQAQSEISAFRTSFDSTYGEGMYDTYNDLFTSILNLPSGTKTVSDLLETLSLDNVSGKIESSLLGEDALSSDMLTASISASDVNSTYLQFMQEQIRSSETVIGMQFAAQSYRENSYVRDYFDSMDQYNLQLAEQFSNAFLQQRMNRLSGQSAMGEASTAQATSGIRQTGSGTNLTTIQQFQNDLSDAAYYSTMDYYIRAYQMEGQGAANNLIDQVYGIRNENAQMTIQFTNDFFNQMNSAFNNLEQYYSGIQDKEEEINQYTENINEINEAWGFEETTEYLS